MSRDFPDWIDVARAAQARREFAGQARLEWMPRVLDMLDQPSADDTIGFEVSLYADEQGALKGVPRLTVRLSGQVPMTCQRSLKRFWQPVEGRSELVAVTDERALESLPGELEPKLVADGRLRLVELVEDELLLALPLVPRDPESVAPDAGVGPAESDRQRPFAALAQLRRDRE